MAQGLPLGTADVTDNWSFPSSPSPELAAVLFEHGDADVERRRRLVDGQVVDLGRMGVQKGGRGEEREGKRAGVGGLVAR